jgi:hypothetical protein
MFLRNVVELRLDYSPLHSKKASSRRSGSREEHKRKNEYSTGAQITQLCAVPP